MIRKHFVENYNMEELAFNKFFRNVGTYKSQTP
jgi:hypothetical protein